MNSSYAIKIDKRPGDPRLFHISVNNKREVVLQNTQSMYTT